jgi:hypothetical protein
MCCIGGQCGWTKALTLLVCASLAAGGLFLASTSLMHPAIAHAAPEPDPIPHRWQLDVEPGALRVVKLDVPDVGPQLFYYMTYKVVNKTGEDLLFTPSFDLATDEGDLVRAGRGVSAWVTREIITKLENEFLQDPIEVVGTFLQGEGNAKESIAIWPVVTAHVGDLEIYGNGFSGELKTIDAYDAATKGTKRVTLRKTLMIRYEPLGETRPTGAEGLPVVEMRWIMR